LVFVFVILLFPSIGMGYVRFQSSITPPALPDSLVYSAAAYYKGQIFLIGGTDLSSQVVSSVYIYSNGNWYYGPSLPFPLMGAGATVCNGNLYVVGGANSSSIFGGILEYTGNGWKIITTSMPDPVYDAIVFSYQNKIYVIGGMNYMGNSLNPPTTTIQVYNLKTNTWEIIGNAPIPLASSAYYFNGSVLFVVGGFYEPAQMTTSVYEYFPENNSWIELTPLPGPEAGGALGYYRGYLFLVGGMFYINGRYQNGSILYYYNGTWKKSGTFEQQPTIFSAYVELGNTLYILGGFGPGNIPSNAMQSISIYLPPPKPQITSVTWGNETITIRWYDTNASGYYLTYWSNLTGYKTINVGNKMSYTLSNLTDGITYYIQITPYNSLGNGTPSNIVNATPASVPNPPIITFKLGNDNATISWNVTFNGGFPILGYYLEVENQTINLSGDVSSYTLTNLTPGKLYTIGIIAYNKIGNSSISTVSFVALAKPNIAISVIKEINGFLVSWNTTSKSGEVKYELTVSQGDRTIVNTTLTNTSYFVKVPFGIYNVSLKAISIAGVSKYSFTEIYYIPPSTPNVTYTEYLNMLYLNWNKTIGAEYYLIYNNGKLIANTSNTSFVLNLSLGANKVEVYAANPYYKSAPSVLNSVVNQVIAINSTYISVMVPQITVAQGENVTSTNSDPLPLKSAIIVILVFVLALLSILVLLRERENKSYW